MPTLNDVLAGSLAQAVQVQQIIDAMKGTPSKGVPVSFTALSDTTNYALTVQNDDATNSRALLVLKSDGTTLIAADATGVTLGSPVNLPAGSITGSTALADASVTNAKLGPDVARANLLTNGGFEIWQRGNGPFTGSGVYTADRWSTSLPGGSMSVSRETTNVDASAAAAAVTFTYSSESYLLQSLVDSLPQLKGKAVSFSMRVRTSTASAVRLNIGDGVSASYSSYHSGGGTYETLTVTQTVATSAASLNLSVAFDASCTAYLDNACLVVGSQAANYVPLHPADDLARCLRYYETLMNTPLTVSFYVDATARTFYWINPFKAVKAVAPTITKVGTWTVGGFGQPTVSGSAAVEGVVMSATSSAGGASVGTIQGGASGYLTAEANP